MFEKDAGRRKNLLLHLDSVESAAIRFTLERLRKHNSKHTRPSGVGATRLFCLKEMQDYTHKVSAKQCQSKLANGSTEAATSTIIIVAKIPLGWGKDCVYKHQFLKRRLTV